MSREALREVLLDLKGQMRGARASAYTKKVSDEKPAKDAPKPRKEESGDSPDDKLGDLKKGDKPDKSSKEEKAPSLDFEAEMKQFMKGIKKPSGKPSKVISFASEAKAQPVMKGKKK